MANQLSYTIIQQMVEDIVSGTDPHAQQQAFKRLYECLQEFAKKTTFPADWFDEAIQQVLLQLLERPMSPLQYPRQYCRYIERMLKSKLIDQYRKWKQQAVSTSGTESLVPLEANDMPQDEQLFEAELWQLIGDQSDLEAHFDGLWERYIEECAQSLRSDLRQNVLAAITRMQQLKHTGQSVKAFVEEQLGEEATKQELKRECDRLYGHHRSARLALGQWRAEGVKEWLQEHEPQEGLHDLLARMFLAQHDALCRSASDG